MATLVLGAIGASIGGSIGGSLLGLSGAVIGRAVGATIGRAIDQRVLGSGSEVVEHGRLDRLRLSTAAEGVAIPRVYGRTRVPGQIIWSTPFEENVRSSGGGGKGGPPQPEVREYSYSVSIAIALCEGEVLRVGRIWADGRELAEEEISYRLYEGTETQLPDSLIEAVEGADNAPAYRGTAYIVMENLALGGFGNRVPQFTFEVIRPAVAPEEVPAPHDLVRGVALIPGTGEFALATQRVTYRESGLDDVSANVNSAAEVPDFLASLRSLREGVPNLRSVSLVVSWFAGDLRAANCEIRPKVEKDGLTSSPLRWGVSGITRDEAQLLPRVDGKSVYGGTPSDASVMEAIRTLNEGGQDVTYYPFILMDQLEGNGLPDPYGGPEQPALPWRGRITTSVAAGRPGSPDGTQDAEAEIAAFFGTAQPEHFALDQFGGMGWIIDRWPFPFDDPPTPYVNYTGPEEWSYRRYVLHQAALCAAAGGVEAFCIGSELVGLTRVRGPNDSFPVVEALRQLARDVRSILPDTKISYAADWSEYFGYHPQDGSGDVFFHLDPLWSDPEIDFVAIDNYMPLSDWRDGEAHADDDQTAIYDLAYLTGNVQGGEGYDWYYPTPEARDAQRRVAIEDGAFGEPWVFRYKDLGSWWSNAHHNRIAGLRQPVPTSWIPESKPIRFTEYGCAAVDKGANQPNKFLDPKSSESNLPYFSRGLRDDTMQMQYIRALLTYWQSPANNRTSVVYGGPMIDLDHSLLWSWDTRPWPAFPTFGGVWADGDNYAFGHWWSGREGSQPLASVVAEMCLGAGIKYFDVSAVFGTVRGYAIREVQSVRADLQPLMLAHGIEASERDGVLVFSMREDAQAKAVDAASLVRLEDTPVMTEQRSPDAELVGRVRVHHMDADGRFEARVGEATLPGDRSAPVSDSELPLSLTRAEGVAIAERFLTEAQLSRESLQFALPPSRLDIQPGDVVEITDQPGRWRVDRIEEGGARGVEASRVDASVYVPSRPAPEGPFVLNYRASAPLTPLILDLPLLRGDEVPQAPYIGVRAQPWPGPVAVYSAPEDAGYAMAEVLGAPAIAGVTLSGMTAAPLGVIDRGAPLRVDFGSTRLSSARELAFLGGANVAAIGDGQSDSWELIQFRDAVPVSPGVWDLSHRLRGQRGTDAVMPDLWPEGSFVVLIDGALKQLDTRIEEIGLERYLRVGPSRFGLDHPTYRQGVFTPRGVGLRPYSPAHLRRQVIGTVHRFSWIPRSRTGGDSWDVEVPLGEARERYALRARIANEVVWEGETSGTTYDVSQSFRSANGFGGSYRFEVAQISDVYGSGAWADITVN